MDTHICRMKESLGTTEQCPGTQCPFWEQDGCGFAELDFRGRPELARFLAGLRVELESVREAEDARDVRSRFFERLNAGRSD
jgi:hypothetical protein